MLKKRTEKELIESLAHRKDVIVSCDVNTNGETDKTSVSVFDSSQKLIKELKDFKMPVKRERISATRFKARFENDELPQEDEIETLSFRQSEEGALQVIITFTPKRKMYFENLLAHKIDNEALCVEIRDLDNEKVEELEMLVSTANNALVNPIIFDRNMLAGDIKYKLKFDVEL